MPRSAIYLYKSYLSSCQKSDIISGIHGIYTPQIQRFPLSYTPTPRATFKKQMPLCSNGGAFVFFERGPEQVRRRRTRRRAKRTDMWYVYILRCADGILYTGSTTDIDRRVKEHNRKKGGGCTRGRLPVKLVHKEPCPNRSEAQKR